MSSASEANTLQARNSRLNITFRACRQEASEL